MKINKSLLAAMLALGVAGIASADDVYITGSTAMRSTIYNALNTANVVFTNSVTFAGNGGGNGSSYMNFTGTLVGGSGTTTIHCHWSGSEAGVLDVASNSVVQETFLVTGATGDSTNNTSYTSPVNVDLALADNAQTYSRTKNPPLVSTKIGVVTFEWVRNPGLWTGTNVTDNQIRQALGGAAPLAVFTGNSSDTGSFVYVEGRDNQSGTRVNTLGVSGYGIFTAVNQIEINSSGVQQTVGGNYIGDFGFSSGGTLAGTLGANTTSATDNTPNAGTGFSIIAYLGISDATTAIGNGATALAYNGVPFSAAAVKEGTYNLWGNEYILKSPNATGSALTAYNRLALLATKNTGVWASLFDGVKAIHLADMHASRVGPNSDISHN